MKNHDRKTTAAALGLGVAMMLGVAGCGGKEMPSDEAVVTTEPGTTVSTAPGAGSAPNPAGLKKFMPWSSGLPLESVWSG